MFNQFHDILGGASIRQAYDDARNLHGRALQTANEILHFSIQSVTKDISLPATGADWNVVAWNLSAFAMEAQIEAEVQWAWEFEWYRGPVTVADDQGNEYPCQLIRERSVIPGFRSRFVFTATLPSLGYKAFRVLRHSPVFAEPTGFAADAYRMESRRYIVEICRETGCIATVFDKQNGRIALADGSKPIVRQDDGDTWAFNVNGFGAGNVPSGAIPAHRGWPCQCDDTHKSVIRQFISGAGLHLIQADRCSGKSISRFLAGEAQSAEALL
jgi:alpha-mannosidase